MHYSFQVNPLTIEPKSFIFSCEDIQSRRSSVFNPNLQSNNDILNLNCSLETSHQIITKKTGTKKDKSNLIKKEKKPKPEKLDKKGERKKNNNTNPDFINGRWTQEEHQKFIDSILKYGNDWRKVEKYIGSRSSTQARSHAQKFFEKMKMANLIDEVIDLSNKTSIKSLQETLKHMEKEKYLDSVKVLNVKPLEGTKMKRSRTKTIESLIENFADLEAKSTMLSKKSITLTEEEKNKEQFSIGKYSINKEDYFNNLCGLSKSEQNKMLKKKRNRIISYDSVDFTKNFQNDYTEMDDNDCLNILPVEVFEDKRKCSDYGDYEKLLFLSCQDSTNKINNVINLELEFKSQENSDKLVEEFLL